MALQEKALKWLRRRSNEEIQQIIAEIIEMKGIVTKEEYSKITAMPERTVYEGVKTGTIPSIDFCGKKYPFINN
jgi:predicted transcriptional regulator